jgi:hypothetical protein
MKSFEIIAKAAKDAPVTALPHYKNPAALLTELKVHIEEFRARDIPTHLQNLPGVFVALTLTRSNSFRSQIGEHQMDAFDAVIREARDKLNEIVQEREAPSVLKTAIKKIRDRGNGL